MKYYATTEQIDQVEFARSIGGRILKHFEDYFNISYPLPKAGELYKAALISISNATIASAS